MRPIPNWSHEEIETMRGMAVTKASKKVDCRWPNTPENSKIRAREFIAICHDEFRQLADPNWPR